MKHPLRWSAVGVGVVVVSLITVVMIAVVPVMLEVLRRPAGMAVEGEEGHTPGVEGGEAGHEHPHDEGEIADRVARVPGAVGRLDDRVLGIEAGETAQTRDAQAGDRDGADRHDHEGHRQVLRQVAVAAHVLLVGHGVDHRSGAQEQQGLEEGVGEQVEHRGLIGADAGCHEHVAKL